MAGYSFRPVTSGDLPLLGEWLREPQVTQWWPDPERQLAGIADDLESDVMRQVIALHNETPVGYAQYYPAHHWQPPHFYDLPADTVAFDVFAGLAGRGHGGAWLRALGDMLLARTGTLVVDPASTNLRTIRAYEKAGFSQHAIRIDPEGKTVHVMTRSR